MVAQVVKIGYLTQDKSLIACVFVNTHLQQLLCKYSLSVDHNNSTNMVINAIF